MYNITWHDFIRIWHDFTNLKKLSCKFRKIHNLTLIYDTIANYERNSKQ